MKIVESYPPNWQLIKIALPLCERSEPIFSFGGVIYNPFKRVITKDLEVHEGVHEVQQGINPTGWWNQYLTDSAFRLQEEIEAYGVQLAYFKKNANNGKLTEWLWYKMAEALSGETYGNLISLAEAKSKIRNYAKTVKV